MKEIWAKRLQQRMAGFEQPVDDALWTGIAQSSVTAGIRWWPWVAAALTAAAAIVTFVLLWRPKPVMEPIIASSGVIVGSVVADMPVLPLHKPVRPAQNTSALPRVEQTASVSPESGPEYSADSLLPQPEATPAAVDGPAVLDEPAEEDWGKILTEEAPPRRRRVKITSSLYAQTSPFGNRHSEGPAQTDNAQQRPPKAGPPSVTMGSEGSTGDPENDPEKTKATEPSLQTSQTETASASPEWTHAFPVQIGARISFSWHERWRLETGLSFVHFSSWTTGQQQRMEYLGIPLSVNYLIGNARGFSFYASAGGQAFKCFAGNAPDKPWLFSCGLGAGAEYHLSPLVSLYAEPGADWFFHTGESRHFYTENPFAFSLSLGFRFHF